MAMIDDKEDFQNWCDLWDQACDKKIFPETPKLDTLSDDFEFDDPAGDYYHNIDRQESEDGILHESDDSRDSDSANPIYPDSVGKDSCVHKTPWVNAEAIEEVADLKKKLYNIECKLNAKDAGGSKWQTNPVKVDDKKIWNQINTLKERINKLSNGLGLREEPKSSMYRTK